MTASKITMSDDEVVQWLSEEERALFSFNDWKPRTAAVFRSLAETRKALWEMRTALLATCERYCEPTHVKHGRHSPHCLAHEATAADEVWPRSK